MQATNPPFVKGQWVEVVKCDLIDMKGMKEGMTFRVLSCDFGILLLDQWSVILEGDDRRFSANRFIPAKTVTIPQKEYDELKAAFVLQQARVGNVEKSTQCPFQIDQIVKVRKDEATQRIGLRANTLHIVESCMRNVVDPSGWMILIKGYQGPYGSGHFIDAGMGLKHSEPIDVDESRLSREASYEKQQAELAKKHPRIKPCPKCADGRGWMFYWKPGWSNCGRCGHVEKIKTNPSLWVDDPKSVISEVIGKIDTCLEAVDKTLSEESSTAKLIARIMQTLSVHKDCINSLDKFIGDDRENFKKINDKIETLTANLKQLDASWYEPGGRVDRLLKVQEDQAEVLGQQFSIAQTLTVSFKDLIDRVKKLESKTLEEEVLAQARDYFKGNPHGPTDQPTTLLWSSPIQRGDIVECMIPCQMNGVTQIEVGSTWFVEEIKDSDSLYLTSNDYSWPIKNFRLKSRNGQPAMPHGPGKAAADKYHADLKAERIAKWESFKAGRTPAVDWIESEEEINERRAYEISHGKSIERKIPAEWMKETGIDTLDLIGWRSDGKSAVEPITHDEFCRRASTSTQRNLKPRLQPSQQLEVNDLAECLEDCQMNGSTSPEIKIGDQLVVVGVKNPHIRFLHVSGWWNRDKFRLVHRGPVESLDGKPNAEKPIPLNKLKVGNIIYCIKECGKTNMDAENSFRLKHGSRHRITALITDLVKLDCQNDVWWPINYFDLTPPAEESKQPTP